ncbi:C39 family peptidase [Bacillus marasmi]|uniref:C39 family peptidase n=1 Tax=Bacillus marasmi TaxID=1926279 RepID=UPI00164E68BD|nr:C39 family peptidase [Bacillus marasmi]
MTIDIKINNRKGVKWSKLLLPLSLGLVMITLILSYYRTSTIKEDEGINELVSEVSAKSFTEIPIKNQTLLSVPFIPQKPELPRGCEVTSLAMLLNFAGVPVSKMELAEKIDKVPFVKNGLRGDMNEGFVGDMYSIQNPGLGVYVDPIFKLANQYLPNRIIDLTNQPIEKLYKMIDEGAPVWVITNYKFKRLPESDFLEFHTKNGSMKVTYSEHSVVITGYNEDFVYLNDPLADEPNTSVNRKDFEEAWRQMGSQAVSVK